MPKSLFLQSDFSASDGHESEQSYLKESKENKTESCKASLIIRSKVVRSEPQSGVLLCSGLVRANFGVYAVVIKSNVFYLSGIKIF